MVADTQIQAGYKRTDIGIIPIDWEVDVIKKHSTITTGAKNTQDRIEDGAYPFFVRSQKVERINSFSFDGEAVLTAGDGVGTGKVFHYINGRFDFHQRVYKLSNFSEKLDGYFFYLYFSKYFYDRIMAMTAKSSVDSVRMEMIADMSIPLPSKPEQKAISQSIIDISQLVAKLDELIEKKCNIKQGAMQEFLTGKSRLTGFSKEWEVKKLGEVLKVRHGKSHKSVLSDTGKYPILASGGQIGWANQFLYNKPSVLIGRKGTIDSPQYMDVPFWTIDTLFYTEVFNNANPKFLYFRFWLIDWYLHNEASGVPSLNAKTIEDIELLLPPDIDEQKAIAQILSDMDEEIEELKTKRDKFINIKQGMMQQLLTGKIRLT